MSSRKTFGLFSLAVLGGLGIYQMRRQVLQRLLKLSPVRHNVVVRRGIKIPMPDGAILVADHYAPRTSGRLFPTVLIRTPYGRGSAAGAPGLLNTFTGQRFAERGYNVIIQDVRGRFDSPGEFAPFIHEKEDGLATLRWIEGQSWFNGVMGMWGSSYLGYVQWAVATEAPLYLKALVPSISSSRIPVLGIRDEAFALDTVLRWVLTLDLMENSRGLRGTLNLLRMSPAAQDRILKRAFDHLPLNQADRRVSGKSVNFYQDWMAHPSANEPYWTETGQLPRIEQQKAAVHLVGGWYDILLRGTLEDYILLRRSKQRPYLTIGPWSHLDFDCMLESLRQGMIWFDAHLKGDRRGLRQKPVRIFVMGENQWREMDDWPPPSQVVECYLHGAPPDTPPRLAFTKPGEEPSSSNYTYDPGDPTPNLGGALMSLHAGQYDNRALESRPDVLTFTSPPLERPLEIIGAVRLVLYLHSNRAYTDFFGRLCDVLPDGRSLNICDGLLRLSPGMGQPQADGSLRIEIDLWSTAYRFAAGHCLRLQVSSGAHPRWSRNPGSGEPLADAVELLPAQQTIYHDRLHPSALILPVTEK